MTVYIEVGNTTFKRAARLNGTLSVQRFDDLATLLPTLQNQQVVVAPINLIPANSLIAAVPAARVITRADVSSFVEGSHDTPNTLGLDRVLNLLGLGLDGVVISCGTAITVDARLDGRPKWGPIMPGFRTAANGLHDRVPVLPLANLEATPVVPARTTQQSIDSGILLGTSLAVRHFVDMMTPGVPVVLTGGDAPLLRRLWDGPTVDDTLLFVAMEQLAARWSGLETQP